LTRLRRVRSPPARAHILRDTVLAVLHLCPHRSLTDSSGTTRQMCTLKRPVRAAWQSPRQSRRRSIPGLDPANACQSRYTAGYGQATKWRHRSWLCRSGNAGKEAHELSCTCARDALGEGRRRKRRRTWQARRRQVPIRADPRHPQSRSKENGAQDHDTLGRQVVDHSLKRPPPLSVPISRHSPRALRELHRCPRRCCTRGMISAAPHRAKTRRCLVVRAA
jgi:hypothetical protein